MTHESGLQQLMGSAAVSAKLVSPRKAESLYRKENEEIHMDSAVFWTSNFLNQVSVTPDAVMKFYSNRAAAYRIPERLQVAYVEFSHTNFLTEAQDQLTKNATNLDNYVDKMWFIAARISTKKPIGTPLTEAAAKVKIREEVRRQLALTSARRAAADFGTALINLKDPNRAKNLDELAADRKMAVKLSPPFDRVRGLEDTDFPSDLRMRAWSLSESNPISFSPIVGSNSVYIVARKGTIASEAPRV